MRYVSPSLAEKLAARASSLCNCWRLTRKDGVVMGFTDHDRDLSFGGVTYLAASGLTATQAETSLGLSAGSGEVAGALQSEGIAERDLANGLYDGASIEIWLVDWSHVEDRLLVDAATIGEVTRGEFSFRAELRSLAHLLDQQRGASFQRGCSADLGDARCGVDLSGAAYRASGVALGAAGGGIVASLSGAFGDDFFSGGRLTITSGAAAGARVGVKSHRLDGADARLSLWTPLAGVAAGDRFEIVAGCDKTAASCAAKFSNIVNFRGFPHMPGNDRIIAYPSAATPAMDGGSLFR